MAPMHHGFVHSQYRRQRPRSTPLAHVIVCRLYSDSDLGYHQADFEYLRFKMQLVFALAVGRWAALPE